MKHSQEARSPQAGSRSAESRSVGSRSRISPRSIPAFLLGGLLGVALFASGPAIARTAAQWVSGGGGAGSVTEPLFAFTENNGPAKSVQVERDLVKLPPEYGEPFAVTASGIYQIVWYRHPELGVRNVVVQGDRRLVHLLEIESIQKSEVSKSGAR